MRLLSSTTLLGFALLGAAHPGEHEKRDEATLFEKRAYHSLVTNGYENCARNLEASGVNKRAALRRRNSVEEIRRDTGLNRQFQQVISPDSDLPDQARKSHLGDPSIDLDTAEDILFSNNGTCVLNPEVMVGPFYVLGEYVRSDLTDGQLGVPMHIDAQFINVETCEPLEGVWYDIWSTNATGVYSGVLEGGDESNLKNTFSRGIQQTDAEGVAKFKTIFPGHYQGRTAHLHVMAHVGNVTKLPNDTIVGGTVAHVGQLFWDQDLIYEVEKTYPYNTNTIHMIQNVEDGLYMDSITDTTSDPIFNYVKLGENIEDGIFAWVSVAVNVSATYHPHYSYRLTPDGDVPETGGDDDGIPGHGPGGPGDHGPGGPGDHGPGGPGGHGPGGPGGHGPGGPGGPGGPDGDHDHPGDHGDHRDHGDHEEYRGHGRDFDDYDDVDGHRGI